MKYGFFLLLLLLLINTGCHRKMSLSKTVPSLNEPVKPLLDSTEATAGTTAPAVPATTAKPIIVVDARGNFAVTEKELPPDASRAILNNENARAYTPAELKTISSRLGKIPPRILYVPQELQKKNSRGTYYVFASKYWYWKKTNGYFYIDEHYYK